MYIVKEEFIKSSLPELLDTPLNLRHVQNGVFTYEGKFKEVRILVESSMKDRELLNYFHTETVSDLLESDTVKVSFNGVYALWVR